MNVEQISVESDERGFELHILTTDEGRMVFNVQAVAVDLYTAVIDQIGPWIAERLDAEREYRTGVSGDPLLQGVLDRIRDDPDDEAERKLDALVAGVDLARKAAKENR